MTIRTSPRLGSPSPSASPAGPEIPNLSLVSTLLEAWYPAAARPLPWRSERSGYRALVSELMLQQTQVARVVDRFASFVARFPTVRALADAPQQDVLAAWQGLGYYRRARFLHRAAQAIRDTHGAEVPQNLADLTALPGIGRYTAGAIASIVFGQPAPIVDGNVLRVLSRLADHDTRMGDPSAERWAWRESTRLVQAARAPGVTNEALMELGATVCTPAGPRCDACPIAAQCAGRASGRAASIPAPRRRAERRTIHWHSLVHVDEQGVLLSERPTTGLWAGMHQPPTIESDEEIKVDALSAAWGIQVKRVAQFTHITSHRTVEFAVFMPLSDCTLTIAGTRRIPLALLESVALSNAAWRVFECAGVPVKTPLSASGGRRAPRAARSEPTGN
ncbi:MAG: A/G-specific adenine glycosylase [Planctomycetota bacterium]|nr:MAG: A/G-specific adenine glycosylase [Planctomycetota bacterium]